MFGIPIEGPSNGFCDNESVIKNIIRPESTLQKKHNAIAYQKVTYQTPPQTTWTSTYHSSTTKT